MVAWEGAVNGEVVQNEDARGERAEGSGEGVPGEAKAVSSSSKRRGWGEGNPEAGGSSSGLGSWAADFGLFVSEMDGERVDGPGRAEINDLVGWGAFEANVGTGVELGTEDEDKVEGAGEAVGRRQRGALGAADEFGLVGVESRNGVEETRAKADLERLAGESVGTRERRKKDHAGGDPKGAAGLRSAGGLGDVTVDGDHAVGQPKRVSGAGEAESSSSGFFSGMRHLAGKKGGDQESVKLDMAARAAGGKLYGLNDRLLTLSTMLEKRSLSSAGKGADSVAAATGMVDRLRYVLKTGGYISSSMRPAEIRRAVKEAERQVRHAEQEVEKDIARLDDAESRQKEALADIAAYRNKLDAARASLTDASTLDGKTLPVLLGALGKVQASLDTWADRLGKSSTTLLQRDDRGASSASWDISSLATYKSKVDDVLARVEEACSGRQGANTLDRSQAQDDVSRWPGDGQLVRARALRRAMLGPEGAERRRAAGRQFHEALDKLDAAMAKADGLRVGVSAHRASTEGRGGHDAFSKAAQEALLAAQELENVGEAARNEDVRRAEGARDLVSMALGDIADIEADVSKSDVADDRSVSEALRVARRGLEKMSSALQEKGGSGANLRDKKRVQALVASGKLVSVLRSVDVARAMVSRVRRVVAAEAEARDILAGEKARVDALSRRAQELGLLARPAVMRAVQACRTAGTVAERFGSQGRQMSPEEREALAKEYMSAAHRTSEETARAEGIFDREKEAAAINDITRSRFLERLESPKATVRLLEDRLDQFAISAERRRVSLESVRVMTLPWKFGSSSNELRDPVPVESFERAALQATAEARKGVDGIEEEVEASVDVAALEDGLKRSLDLVALAETATAQVEVRGRRRGNAIATLERAAVRTETVFSDAREAKVDGRPAVVASLADATQQVRGALVKAISTAKRWNAVEVEVDDMFLAAAVQAQQVAEAAAESLARESLLVEQMEEQRRQRCTELWSAARRLEGLDTGSVVGDDPEAAAMVLEARSEAMQVLVALESSQDPADLLHRAQAAVENAFRAEEYFFETQRKVRCFDDATRLLEQAEALVDEAQTTMKASNVPATSRASFEQALQRYEGVLTAAATSSDGADAFFEACTAAFAAARGVDRAAVRASRRALAHKERVRRELARLDRPAASLAALDLSELTESSGKACFGAVAEQVRDSLSAINSVREEVAQGSSQFGDAEEAALVDQVDSVVQAAASAERDFRTARDRVRRMERGWQQLINPEAGLAKTKEKMRVLPNAQVVSELCAASMRRAEESLASARASVAAIGEDDSAAADLEVVIEDASIKVSKAQEDAEEQATRVKSAASQRQLLRSALETSDDSIAQAQAGLEAEQHGQSPADSMQSCEGRNGDPMFEALQACSLAEAAAAVARESLDRPLTADWFRAADNAAVREEESLVEAAQTAATEAEQAAARLMERLGQIRGIRAKLRSLLAHSEARFRQASAELADVGVTDINEVHVASAALALARDRLRSSLGSGYLAPGGGSGSSSDGGGSLARDEEAVSEAAGFVEALTLLASRTVAPARAEGDSPASRVGPKKQERENEALDALALALQWGEALRVQVSELELEDDPAVARAIEATAKAAQNAESLWSRGTERNQGGGSGGEARAAVEGLATQLGELESVTEKAAEQRRAHEAGLGAAARRFNRLITTLASLREAVKSAGEPLLVSLTAEALNTAQDAITAASEAGGGGGSGEGPGGLGAGGDNQQVSSFTDAVQAAAVAVAQAEATVTRARERAPQVSADRVRTLEALVGLAETLSEAGEKLASSSLMERGLPSSREAAAAILEAQEGLSRARKAAQVDGGAWLSGFAAITEAVAEAGELVRRATRAADLPTAMGSSSTGGGRTTGASDIADVGVEGASSSSQAPAGKEDDGKGEGAQHASGAGAADVKGRLTPKAKPEGRKARIGFSKEGSAGQTYLPLWMRLQKKVWEGGGSERQRAGASDVPEQPEQPGDPGARPADPTLVSTSPSSGRTATSTARAGRYREDQEFPPTYIADEESSRETALADASRDRRRREEDRLRAEADRLRAEAARLRARRAGASGRGVASTGIKGSRQADEPHSFKQAAEALAEEMVNDFAKRAKKEAQQRRKPDRGQRG